jgi:hypothetical protein
LPRRSPWQAGEPHWVCNWAADWWPGITWKDALTGRGVRVPTGKAVFIGKGYNKLSVIANEPGHASELGENTWSTKAGTALDVRPGAVACHGARGGAPRRRRQENSL